ncbi:MAG: protein kinase [Myxococcales bacterium]|nr:protein kinase [Myxococcales bacterium]
MVDDSSTSGARRSLDRGGQRESGQWSSSQGNHDSLELARATEPLGTSEAPRPISGWPERYVLHGQLGRGGMSIVYSVYDRVMERDVAMKVFDRVSRPDRLRRFLAEARITGRLDHPNIVPVYDVQADDGALPTRFTMKRVEGETLEEALYRLGESRLSARSLEWLLGIFIKVCDAVAFAHGRSVVHCDLKPSNIMIGEHGQVYVMDWGVAVDRSAEALSGEGAREAPGGTPAFMAPEQVRGTVAQIDERTDVYGLGALLYAILTVLPPHDGKDAREDEELAAKGIVPRPEVAVPNSELPPGLCHITMRALAADPTERYESVSEIKEAVQDFQRGGGWFETVRFEAGEAIVREGELPDAAYIMLSGRCEVFRERDGQRHVMNEFVTGNVFGEISIFGGSRRTASVSAATETTVLKVTREALGHELERTAWLKAFVESLAERFIDVETRLRQYEDGGRQSNPD